MFSETYMDKPILGILLGDAAGVGPEIVAKVAAKGLLNEYCHPIIIGDARVLKLGMKIAEVDFPLDVIDDIDCANWSSGIPVFDQKNLNPEEIALGEVSPICGKASGDMLVTAVNLYKEGKIHGFCFAPLNKGALKKAGFNYESEHYLFAHLFNWKEPFGEINVLDELWTSRVTSHIPVKEISDRLSVETILRAMRLVSKTLERAGMENARIAVAALNPHAGENGLCGREELDVIIPAMEEAKKLGINAVGPYPSDILFIKAFKGEFDAVVTMYHDQGQIAMKLKGFEQGITIAGGLPAAIVTASHGTAYDIAGKGIAKTEAFENAVKMAARIALSDRQRKESNAS
ncbi:4-hydroxythreonine-4-phosphate dehydrogenase PdxA [Clostridium swellfunianum]|uniref:4-hydroxythreonine-4-phosphate dehydrogenase PdxA n=1 Tax=Clostridium swellfunianum TaxID=1367462 RepID=UPI00202FE3AA|nr:4-hydroxythreonine-4-phosphate dehydrogenase PdxA [Clostridium swellfunianum]MCM0650929.1 4-hydroxythreonine-4-phosphate dehydrogenase PdxA [Clostridium swellfunianum]